jgi:hypothetical protein
MTEIVGSIPTGSINALRVSAANGLCKWPDVLAPTKSKNWGKAGRRYRESRVQLTADSPFGERSGSLNCLESSLL